MAIAIPQFSELWPERQRCSRRRQGGDRGRPRHSRWSRAEVQRPHSSSWFTQHGLNYDPTDIAAIERHVAKGWVFVTARASATAEAAELVSHNGMLAPLVLVFPTRKMVYPLALTATIGQNTAIELFVYNKGKVDSAAGCR
jgi:hypothetical protein